MSILAADIGDRWLYWPYVTDQWSTISDALREHVVLTALALALGVAVAVPLGLLAFRRRWLYPPMLAAGGALYTIPSLAFLALLLPITGLSVWTAVIPLATYTLQILVRNIVTGLQGVAADVSEAATGMGYSARRRLATVELPLALPAIFAGLRIATVSTIGLVPVTALIGWGGLGVLMRTGLQRDFRTPLVVGLVLTVVLAVAADLLLLLVERLVTPWARRAAR